jgi:hypothetical protein
MGISGSQLAPTYARANRARFGAARTDYYRPINLHLRINGSPVGSRLDVSSFTLTLEREASTLSFVLLGGTAPTVGQEVVAGLGSADNRLFGGRIVSITTHVGFRVGARVQYLCQAVDYTFDFKRLVLRRYTNWSASAMVADLMTRFAPNFSINHVQTGLPVINEMAFTMESVPAALTRIAQAVGASWYVDPNKDLHFFTTDTTKVTVEAITASSLHEWRHLQHTTDLSGVRTRVYVEGRGGPLRQNWNASYELGQLYVDEAPILFADPTIISPAYVRVKQARVRYQLIHSTPPPTYLVVHSESVGEALSHPQQAVVGEDVNQWVERNDTSAQTALAGLEGGDGIREAYVQDRRLSYDGCVARGDAELAVRATPDEAITYETRDPNSWPGRSVTVNVAGISGTYRIQRVQLRGIELDGRNDFPLRRVWATNRPRDFYAYLREFEQSTARRS